MFFNVSLSEEIPVFVTNQAGPLFENLQNSKDEQHAVKMICDYINHSSAFCGWINISPKEYRKAAYGDIPFDPDSVLGINREKSDWISYKAGASFFCNARERSILCGA